MPYKFNPFTGKLDLTDMPSGAYFSTSSDTLQLNWNGVVVQSWTYTPVVATISTGNPIGLLLALTYTV